jgi:hypothetical protein
MMRIYLMLIRNTVSFYKCCGARVEFEGAESKLPPGAGAKIKNCCSRSGSCSFLFTTDFKKFYRKNVLVAEEVFVDWYPTILILLLKSKKVIFKVYY